SVCFSSATVDPLPDVLPPFVELGKIIRQALQAVAQKLESLLHEPQCLLLRVRRDCRAQLLVLLRCHGCLPFSPSRCRCLVILSAAIVPRKHPDCAAAGGRPIAFHGRTMRATSVRSMTSPMMHVAAAPRARALCTSPSALPAA